MTSKCRGGCDRVLDRIRHADVEHEVECLALKLDEYEHRAKLHMDRCQHDMERIVALEQQNEALASRLEQYRQALAAIKDGVPLPEQFAAGILAGAFAVQYAPAVERTVTNEETSASRR